MAARARRSAAHEVVDVVEEDDEQEEEGAPKKLQFKQPLVGRPGKQIGVGDLLARLKALCEELRNLEQEEADRESLEPVAKDLAHQSLLQHKDGGVRAWVACCIVDIFRLCAPNAPYTASQLKVGVGGHVCTSCTPLTMHSGYIHPNRSQDLPPPRRPLKPV
jgi:sister-chromatid-cohesion protein PDS5